jgi:hypothetical protein
MHRSTLLVAATVIATSGCLDYTIDTTVRADGSGVRSERMEVTRNDDFDLPPEALLTLTRSGATEGWRPSMEIQADGDTTWIQERQRSFGSPSSWAATGESVVLLGALPERADDRLGLVRLGDVRLRSAIQVRSARGSDGSTSISYRESFVWDDAAAVMVEFLIRDVDHSLRERYPRVPELERGGILGFARARVRDAGEAGLFFDENTADLVARAVDDISTHALRVIRVYHEDARQATIAEIFSEAFSFDDEDSSRLFTELLPGLNLAFNTSVVFRLTMPGSVTTTNAGTRDGSVLEWEFSPLDDLRGPIEIYAESVIRP